LDAGHAHDLQVAVADQTAVEPRRNLVKFQSGYYASKPLCRLGALLGTLGPRRPADGAATEKGPQTLSHSAMRSAKGPPSCWRYAAMGSEKAGRGGRLRSSAIGTTREARSARGGWASWPSSTSAGSARRCHRFASSA